MSMEESRYDPTCNGREGATVARPSPAARLVQRSAQRAECRELVVHSTTGSRRSARHAERCLFRILYHQSLTIVAQGQLVLGDTFGYQDNFCIPEGPSDREACTLFASYTMHQGTRTRHITRARIEKVRGLCCTQTPLSLTDSICLRRVTLPTRLSHSL